MQSLEKLVEQRDVPALKAYMAEHDLVVRDGKIKSRDPNAHLAESQRFNFLQLAAKIRLNSLYGALLNNVCRFYDERIGQSTTLSGRSIVKHMNAKNNEIITGIYDYKGDALIYSDTDSNPHDTTIYTSSGRMTIEALFELCAEKWKRGDKEYSCDPSISVLSYDPKSDKGLLKKFNYVYRHKVKKPRWRVTDSFGNQVEMTGDHSMMIERDGQLLAMKPRELLEGDIIISLDCDQIAVKRSPVAKIEQLDDFDDEYVYDIGVDLETPYFFANDILVHNSSYFSAYEVLKDHPDYKDFDWSRENVIALYDMIADETNATFPEFMRKTFHTTLERGGLIKAGRELVASKGLFIKKKKYAVMIYDLEGTRLDKDGKPGKLKPMGLDLKRADTPRFMQKFLESLLVDILTDKSNAEMYESVREFRRAFKDRPGWEKGAPKKVRNLNHFNDLREAAANRDLRSPLKKGEKLKVNMPGHVLASLNWNLLCDLNDDRHAMRITDSARIIVCKLRKNSYDMTSIAYPIDEAHLPKWFQELPFDHAEMENVIIDKKLTNLVGVLDWDLADTMEYGGDDFFA